MMTKEFDAVAIRNDFPTLHQTVNGHPFVYLDNAATAQKPQSVIDRMDTYYRLENANIHRGIHTLSQLATDAYELTRKKVKEFINAKEEQEIIFTRGTTEAINLVAYSYGRHFLKPGDEIIISEMEHHSNIVPWQLACEATGAILKAIPVLDRGELDIDAYRNLLSPKTKIVSVVHLSNTLGTINPVQEMIKMAHEVGAIFLLDGAQSVTHMAIDVQDLDCDFFTISAHKLIGPTGIGCLYGKAELLEKMPPFHGGGDMIKTVTIEKTTFNELPHKFEAGTPNISAGIGWAASFDYLIAIGMDVIETYEHQLLTYATDQLQQISGLRIIGTAPQKGSVISFVMKEAHPHDIGTILDQEGIAIRTGHHCTQPLMKRFQVPGTARASFSFYNTKEDIDRLVKSIHKVKSLFE